MTVFQTYFWWTWQSGGLLLRYQTMPLNWVSLMFFSWLDGGYRFGGERSERYNDISMTSHQEYRLSIWFMTVGVDIDHLDVRIFHCKVLLFLPLSTFPFFGRKLYAQPYFRSRNKHSPPLHWSIYISYLEFFCMRYLSLFFHLLISSVY